MINRVAHFHSEICPAPRACMVTNISDGGARLYTETDVPPTFTLSVSGEGVKLRRECRVVWRLGGELGVEFTDRASAKLEAIR
jgi:PilZ domain